MDSGTSQRLGDSGKRHCNAYQDKITMAFWFAVNAEFEEFLKNPIENLQNFIDRARKIMVSSYDEVKAEMLNRNTKKAIKHFYTDRNAAKFLGSVYNKKANQNV